MVENLLSIYENSIAQCHLIALIVKKEKQEPPCVLGAGNTTVDQPKPFLHGASSGEVSSQLAITKTSDGVDISRGSGHPRVNVIGIWQRPG